MEIGAGNQGKIMEKVTTFSDLATKLAPMRTFRMQHKTVDYGVVALQGNYYEGCNGHRERYWIKLVHGVQYLRGHGRGKVYSYSVTVQGNFVHLGFSGQARSDESEEVRRRLVERDGGVFLPRSEFVNLWNKLASGPRQLLNP